MNLPNEAGLWRPMRSNDLAAVERVAEVVHPNYPEDIGVLDERRRLSPGGCFVIESGGEVQGYVVAHPWRLGRPPKLNAPLRALPADVDTLYLHDLALLPPVRGRGAGRAIVDHLATVAERSRFATMSLVAVSFSVPFWTANGFELATPAEALSSYGEEARFMIRGLLR